MRRRTTRIDSRRRRPGRTGVENRDDFRRTAVRNLEGPGAPRSAATAMVGHRTSIYRRYAIADEAMLKEGALKLAAFHAAEANDIHKVRPVKKLESDRGG